MRRCRQGATLRAAAVVVLAIAAAGWSSAGSASTFVSTFCAMTTEAAYLDGGTAYVSGSCYDWSVSPSYGGTAYADNSAADASEPPPPAPVTPALPTWRNLYDWPNGHGYVGWRTASSSQAGAYGMQTALGGQDGLWLWPQGGTSFAYQNGNYAEFSYTAPGTTRIANATVLLSYRNKLLAHHCIDVGFRTSAGVVTHNEHCKPAAPPDSQRQVTISLVDPSTNPTSKTLFFRIRVDCGGATTCSKNIPALDPLSTGGFARLLKVDLTLVDDDKPTLELASDGVDAFNDTYTATVKASDAGSGIKSLQIARDGGPVLASANAPCDPTHKTPALDTRICPQDFTLTGSLDISDLEDGTYGFTATAVDVAGNVGVLHWTVTINRVSLDVAFNPLTATPRDKYTFASQTDFGWTAGQKIPKASMRQGFKWRFALAPGQVLEPLSNGGIAVVAQGADVSPDAAFADDYLDQGADDPALLSPFTEVDENDGTSDDLTDDSTDDGSTDDWTPGSSGSDSSLDSVGAADQEITDGSVVAVVRPPTAKDLAGLAVATSFSISGNVATLTVSHHAAPYAYPVTASADLVDATGNGTDASETATTTSLRSLATTASQCPTRTRITVYGEHGTFQLLKSIQTYPTPCADYYFNIPSRPGTLAVRRVPRAGSAQQWCAANTQSVLDVGARIYPVAEFHWGAWRPWANNWAATHNTSVPNGWRRAGQEFRRLMKTVAGFGGDCPAYADTAGGKIPERWAINELPSSFTQNVRKNGVIVVYARDVQNNVDGAITGLYAGLDGFGERPVGTEQLSYPDTRGITFVIDAGAARLGGFNSYRPGLRTLLLRAPFWNDMKKYVLWWGQEAYSSCYKQACIDSMPRSRRAFHTNNFTLHPANFAFAAARSGVSSDRTRTIAARTFFNARYFPLLNAFWGKLVPTDTYGNTDKLSLASMRTLVSVQLYGARRHSVGGASTTNPGASTAVRTYPGLRIGVAWQDEAATLPDGSTNPDFAPSQALADHTAQALRAAFTPASAPDRDLSWGSANAACTIDGVDWCAGRVPNDDGTNPASPYYPAANQCYRQFLTWTGRAYLCN